MEMTFLEHLKAIAQEDAAGLTKAAESYGDSWKSRGGVGAFMMLARKWDRIDNALNPAKWPKSTTASIGVERFPTLAPMSRWAKAEVPAWDILSALSADPRPEGILDDVRDLRRYLMLCEAELRARGIVQGNNHRDNK